MEADIKFERENRTGIIPVGTYIYDVAGRFGIELDCEEIGETTDCVVQILKGKEFLSDFTKSEKEYLTEDSRKKGERLARQAKIEKSGEVVIMTKAKVVEEKEEEKDKQEAYRKEFEELPLEKKIASLVELEAIALGETFSFVLNSPYKIADKVMDVLAEFGMKFEKEEKEAAMPKEHQENNKKAANVSEDKKDVNATGEQPKKPKTARKPRPGKTPEN
ncbi:hypothetical protein BH10ACI1_BH10ACI1_30760 [soil metagenome]